MVLAMKNNNFSLLFRLQEFMWNCKDCGTSVSSRFQLLKHFKLRHGHYGRNFRYPCAYASCPCTFKTWNNLLSHIYRDHSKQTSQQRIELYTFHCQLCACNSIATEKEYFIHINTHLRKNETVTCMFLGCTFQTNILGTFNSHKYRKHNPHTLKDLKTGVVTVSGPLPEAGSSTDNVFSYAESDVDLEVCAGTDADSDIDPIEELPKLIERKVASVLLKLENLVHVPTTAIDEVLGELDYLIRSASIPVTSNIVSDLFKNHKLQVDESIIKELSTAVCTGNPLGKAIEKNGPLGTAFKRKQYYKKHFNVVEPIEFVLDSKTKRSFQYIPLLKSLQQLLDHSDVIDKVIETHRTQVNEGPVDDQQQYKSLRDGQHFKENTFLSSERLRITVTLYVDDFEICNPLGTSRKTHKLCGVYWILSNLPPGSHSELSSIYLALLCKSDDIKTYGYGKVLNPLLQDLVTLEKQGVFISSLGEFVKGTVHCVIADNLGAHGIGGFVESFSGDYFCRFCTGKKSEIQSEYVQSGTFSLRTKEIHEEHIESAKQNGNSCCGVKTNCVFSEHLAYFHVTKGYPPDIAHDLFEGVIPVELAYCLGLLISKKYFTLESLNATILKFPYKWGDKTNRPHVIQRTFTSKKTIGGNAHENWSLIRLLPFIIGHLIPEDELAWQVVLDLKDIVELAVAPVHTDTTIAYLESKISDHRHRYCELFPDARIKPKQHYIEHYPEMIRCFGPLVGLWTMRFEAKHSFFKQVARHTNCFKNVTYSLSAKHQLMVGYYMYSSSLKKSSLEVTSVSTVPVDVLNEEVALSIKRKYPDVTEVNLAKNVSSNGLNYRNGMIVAHGSTGGLPEFAEILQMCIVKDQLSFIVRVLCAWYRDHFRAFELTPSPGKEVALIELAELADTYPLADYMVGGIRMVTLKRHIIV